MKSIIVFEPALCCPTGVCGPAIDPVLVRFAGDVTRLKEQGVNVVRHNLAQEPAVFAQTPAVAAAIQQRGLECLPLVVVAGEIRSTSVYPSREQLMRWAEVPPTGDQLSLSEAMGGCGCGARGCR